jgi:hypothetical protein
LELIKIGGATIGRATFEPGWRWSTSIQDGQIPLYGYRINLANPDSGNLELFCPGECIGRCFDPQV